MTRTEVTVDVAAGPEYVWAVLTDVVRWPGWTTAVREVTLLDAGVLGPGGMVRVRAPGLPDRTWRVSGWSAGRSFTWTGSGVGARATLHVRLRRGEGVTRVCLSHERAGWLSRPVVWLTGRTQRRHLRSLADGLRHRCEHRRAGAQR